MTDQMQKLNRLIKNNIQYDDVELEDDQLLFTDTASNLYFTITFNGVNY